MIPRDLTLAFNNLFGFELPPLSESHLLCRFEKRNVIQVFFNLVKLEM